MPKAIRISQPGPPDVMKWEDYDPGDPGAGEVLIRHGAVGLNYIDTYHRSGLYPVPTPFTPGMEGAGTVIALGPGVDGIAEGDRVAYASIPLGSYAEVRSMPADRVVRIPDGISDAQAAAMMLQGMTAQFLLNAVHQVGPNDTILVHAAAGGVGLILCQWAKHLGAKVIGTVGSPAKAELAAAHGCDHPILYRHENFVERVKEITGGAMLPVVYDSVGRDTFPASLDCLRPRGLFVTFGNASGPVPDFNPGLLMAKGSLVMTRPSLPHFIATREELEMRAADLFRVVGEGAVRIEVNQTYALKDAVQAHTDLESRKTTGSTVLLP